MKTSNRLLWAAAGFLVLCALAGQIYVKKNMVITKVDKSYLGNGTDKTVQLTEVLLGDTLVLSDSYKYSLNPNSKAVTVTTDANLVEEIKITDGNELHFFREGNEKYEPSALPRVSIGVMGKSSLVIILGDLARLSNLGVLQSDLVITADDRTSINLNVENTKFSLELENRAKAVLIGETKLFDVIVEDNASLDAMDVDITKLILDLSDKARMKAYGAASVDIKMEDRAVLDFDAYWTLGKVRIEESAKFKIAGQTYDKKYVQIAEPD